MPLPVLRSSGSRVRFPVITTLLMLVAAIRLVPFLASCGRLDGLSVEGTNAVGQVGRDLTEVARTCAIFYEVVTKAASAPPSHAATGGSRSGGSRSARAPSACARPA